ncbi:MAG: LamG domain-containing protein [Myxococcales bacterium]|nr:LamG domain-containing protein [Myxococcales bacterium]
MKWPKGRLVLALCLGTLMVQACTVERTVGRTEDGDWASPQRAYRIPIALDTEPFEGLADVPVLLRLPKAVFGGVETSPDGADLDLRSADTGEALAFEVDTWTSEGESLLWVHGLADGPDGETEGAQPTVAHLYFGTTDDPGGASQSGERVFGDDYLAVHHLSAPPFEDSSPSGSALSDSGSSATEGLFGTARRFGPGGAKMALSTAAFPDAAEPVTVCMWVRPSRSISGFQSIFGYGTPPRVLQEHAGEVWLRSGDDITIARDALTVDTWTHLCAAIQTDNIDLYTNGALAAENSSDGYGAANGPASIGQVMGFDSGFEGDIDEIRITGSFASAARVGQEYRAMVESWLVPQVLETRP